MEAIFSDKNYHEGIANSNDTTEKELSRQRAEWYRSLYENMSKKVQIQPAEHVLK